MCWPLAVMLPYIAGATAVAGAGVSAYSAYETGESQKKAADYNAQMQQQAARSTMSAAAAKAADQKERARKIASAGVAASAAGGMDPNTGTPLNLTVESIAYGELDALRIQNNAQRQAWGLATQANLDAWQGKNAETAGWMNAGASLLGGASKGFFGLYGRGAMDS